MKSFASDNYAGVHPDVLAALADANVGHAPAYGADPWTTRAQELFRRQFGPEAQTFFVFNGTGANVLALRAACRPWEAVICAESAHIHVDECGAPERVAGIKLLVTPTPDGKLTPADIERLAVRAGDEHQAQARLVSISQSTELGTCYEPAEIRALTDHAHARGLLVHVDGARLTYAAAAQGTSLRAQTTDAGVDLLSFGGTKTGAMAAEAVVLMRPELGDGFRYLRKQSMQLASKGRFVAAQFQALLSDELGYRLAGQANEMARRLARQVNGLAGLTITRPVQANAVFAILPPAAVRELQGQWPFHVWDEQTGEVRWMCSWDTTIDDVDDFAAAIVHALNRAQADQPPAPAR